MLDLLQDYTKYARELREANQLAAAGEYYVAGAHGRLMRFRPLPDDTADGERQHPTSKPSQFVYGLRDLLLGALCFRLDHSLSRCQNQCQQGCLIISDLLEVDEFESAGELGLCREISGDFRVVGNLDQYAEAYDAAAEVYADVDSHLGWQMKDGFDDFSLLVTELADSVGYNISSEIRETVRRTSLDTRIQFKHDNFPEIIDAVLDNGNWDSDIL